MPQVILNLKNAIIKQYVRILISKKKKCKEQQDKICRYRVQLMQIKLTPHGYKYEYGATIDEGKFSFWSARAANSFMVSEALADEGIIDFAIAVSEKAKVEEEEFKKIQEIRDAENKAESERKQILEQKEREDKEAKQKVKSRKDLLFIDEVAGSISEKNEMLIAYLQKFEVITPYAESFTKRINDALNEFTKSVSHLRPKQ